MQDRKERHTLAKETQWAWIQRAGWLLMGGIALALWEYIKRHINE